MLALDDERWIGLKGGYRMPIDAPALLRNLESSADDDAAWAELWDELHHQGDVGEASYAAVPHLVRIYRTRGAIDWTPYAMVAIIELARIEGNNPEIPDWLKADYFQAIHELSDLGASQILKAEDEFCARSILGLLAISKGLRVHGELLVEYSADELIYMRRRSEEDD
jgi:hypothetical protein